MKRLIFVLIFCSLLFIPLSESQSDDENFGVFVGGSVLDENNQPLSGVRVVVKGTDIKAVTDFEGYYGLQTIKYLDGSEVVFGIPYGKQKIQYSFVGYRVAEISIEFKPPEIPGALQTDVLAPIKMEPIPLIEPIPPIEREETSVDAYSIKILDS